MTPWRKRLAAQRDGQLRQLKEFLAIASVSAQPEHAGDVRRAAEWVAERLKIAGLQEVALLETGGHPAVFGQWCGRPEAPTVLIYGHFDVQPPDPLERWDTDPFDPVVRDGKIFARGASDDKGNMLAPILVLEAMLRAEGRLPVNVKCLFEGQEEIGSPQMDDLLARHARLLACDLVLNADAVQLAPDRPALTLGLRGLVGLEVEISGPDRDLHSGTYGGVAPNPAHGAAQLICTLHRSDGAVAVKGFYDAVVMPSDDLVDQLAQAAPGAEDYRRHIGTEPAGGQADLAPFLRAWCRPALDVNGLWSGYCGPGAKTIIPAKAHFKLSCRLVPDQDPHTIARQVTEHLQAHCPAGLHIQVRSMGSAAAPYRIAADHPGNQAAAAVLQEIYGRPPAPTMAGFTVPVCAMFRRHLGADTVGFGFGLDDEKIHSPNEFFRLESFYRAQHAWGRLLEQLAGVAPDRLAGAGKTALRP